jgi:hypothetical protein
MGMDFSGRRRWRKGDVGDEEWRGLRWIEVD